MNKNEKYHPTTLKLELTRPIDNNGKKTFGVNGLNGFKVTERTWKCDWWTHRDFGVKVVTLTLVDGGWVFCATHCHTMGSTLWICPTQLEEIQPGPKILSVTVSAASDQDRDKVATMTLHVGVGG